ncbi:taurine ABC transporter permease TauC [soil metagenome]
MTEPVVSERLRPAEELIAPSAPIRRRERGRWALGLIVPATLLGIWAVASAAGWISPRLLPSPATVADAGWAFVAGGGGATLPGVVSFEGAAAEHVSASVGRWAVAYALAVVVGLSLGLAIGLSRRAADLLDPFVQAIRSIPITAWLPIALVWFGLGEGAARYLVFIGAVFPIVIATADSAGQVSRSLVDTAAMLGTPRRALARRVYVPAALPGIVTGLRLGLTLGWMSVIVGELTGASSGVGAMMFAAREVGRLDQIIVGMATFAIIGLLGDLALRRLARPFVAWADG